LLRELQEGVAVGLQCLGGEGVEGVGLPRTLVRQHQPGEQGADENAHDGSKDYFSHDQWGGKWFLKR
jgi:hypothetical protein